MHHGLNLVHNFFELWRRHRPLFASLQEALQNFLPFEALAPPILLDHHVGNFIDALVGGKTSAAFQALAPAADGVPAATFPGIDYFVIHMRTKRTLHEAGSPYCYRAASPSKSFSSANLRNFPNDNPS